MDPKDRYLTPLVLDAATGQVVALTALDGEMLTQQERAAIEARTRDVCDAVAAAEARMADPADDAPADVQALAGLRRGQATDGDRALVSARWGYEVPIAGSSAEEMARAALPDLKRYQFRAIVELAGLASAVSMALDAIPDPVDCVVAWKRYESSDVYRRSDPLFTDLAGGVGITAGQIDDLWAWAITL